MSTLHSLFAQFTARFTAWGKFWLAVGLVSLFAASSMSYDFGEGVSTKHALFLACLSFVTAFLPDAAHAQWEVGRKGAAIGLVICSLPLFAIEFFSHAGYTAGLRGLNVAETHVQNVRYDGAQKSVTEDEDRLAWAKKRLAQLTEQNGWSATVTADALRARLPGLNLAIENEARRGGCKTICEAKTRERDEINARIAVLEERTTLQRQIDGTKALLDKARDKAATVEHKSSAVEHQNAFLTKAVSLTFNGQLNASPVLQESVQQAVNLGMALVGTGLPALALFTAGLYRRKDDEFEAPPAAKPVSVSREMPPTMLKPQSNGPTTINVTNDNELWQVLHKVLNGQKQIAA